MANQADQAALPAQSLAVRIGKKVRHPVNRIIAASSEVGDRPVFEPDEFDWSAALVKQAAAIRQEALAVLDGRDIPSLAHISPDHARIAQVDMWKSFFLFGYGYRIEENCAACPVTAAAVERIPGLFSAFFSVLNPGTHIPRHRGVSKAVLTAHLGLTVPEPAERCRMQLDDRLMLRWREGELLVFDDCFYHEVWNETPGTRVVLLIQFRRPTGLLGQMLGSLFLEGARRSAFVQTARRNLEASGATARPI